MATKLYSVVVTESPNGDQDFQVRVAPTPAEFIASAAPLGRATVYVISPIAARTARDARAHALAMISEEGLRAIPVGPA